MLLDLYIILLKNVFKFMDNLILKVLYIGKSDYMVKNNKGIPIYAQV